MNPRHLSLAAVLALAVVLSSNLFAANIITSGTLQIGPPFDSKGAWTLSGNNFTVNGYFYVSFWYGLCYVCAPGDLIQLGGWVGGIDFYGGSATVGGQYYPNVNWGALDAAGPTTFYITVPGIPLNRGFGTYSANFYLKGSLCGVEGSGGPCEVSLPRLVGGGIVSFQFTQSTVQPQYGQILSADFTFTYPYTTPEPSSIMLLGSGALGLFGTLLRKLNRH